MERSYIAIDLKSFYASVECVERNLDPLDTNLVVADKSRTSKTICLAVTPSLKSYGISGRARLFEAEAGVSAANAARKNRLKGRGFSGKSFRKRELDADPTLEIDFIVAPPRMQLYMEYSREIYEIYLQYVAAEDMHIYSVDEVFLDVTSYSKMYGKTPEELAADIINQVLQKYGITATAGIGTNMYLAKIAMDIVAKHAQPDENGVRIASLDEKSYRRLLWTHEPLTDFWRIGPGYARKLKKVGLTNMGDIARCSIGKKEDFYNEELLYEMFGKNAQLLIDHAWGWEPATIADIHAYKPADNSLSNGQVLTKPYSAKSARLVVREMTDNLVLDMVKKGLVASQMVLTVGYDIDNINDEKRRANYKGEVVIDRYGRKVPKSAHGSINLGGYTSSTAKIMDAITELYDRIVDTDLLVRRMYVVANHVRYERDVEKETEETHQYKQLSLFDMVENGEETAGKKSVSKKTIDENKEKKIQEAILSIRDRYGKNALLKGMNLEEDATAMERNAQIGGHKA